MFEFLEDCPMGYENDVIMYEACLLNADKANLALNTFNALDDIRMRAATLNRNRISESGSFDKLVTYYEEENNKNDEANGQKQNLIQKAWAAIGNLFGSISNFFKKLGKVPDGSTVVVREDVPEGISKLAEFSAALKNLISVKTVAAALATASAAGKVLDWFDNVWNVATGKKTKRMQKAELEKTIQTAQDAADTLKAQVKGLGDAESELSKKWSKEAAEKEAEASALKNALSDLTAGTVWGRIRKALTDAGNWLQKQIKALWNKILGKTGDEDKDNDDESNKDKDDAGSDDKKDSDTKKDQDEKKNPSDGTSQDDQEGAEATGESAEDDEFDLDTFLEELGLGSSEDSSTPVEESSDDTDPDSEQFTEEWVKELDALYNMIVNS